MDLELNGLLEKIHADALRVLEEVGVKCVSKEVRQIFEDTGLAAFDEGSGHIHVLAPLIEQVLATAPKRDQYWIPEDSFGVGGTAPFLYDDQTGELVEPTFAHLARIARIVDEADVIQFMARGVLIKNQEVRVMNTIVENCHKPIYVAAVTDEGIERALAIHKTRGNITVQFSIINSPLNVIESMIDPFLSCVRKGIPIYVSTMPMAGLSGPYSMSGLVTLTHAEALFGITLTQLINPGLMVVHAGLPSIANIRKNYAVDLGLRSHNIANLLMDKVNKCLEIQDKMAQEGADRIPRLGELLVEHGFVDGETIRNMLKLQNKDILFCTNCNKQYNVVGVEEGKTYRCKDCGGILLPKTLLDTLSVDETTFGIELDQEEKEEP